MKKFSYVNQRDIQRVNAIDANHAAPKAKNF